jgi:hypothetical protein
MQRVRLCLFGGSYCGALYYMHCRAHAGRPRCFYRHLALFLLLLITSHMPSHDSSVTAAECMQRVRPALCFRGGSYCGARLRYVTALRSSRQLTWRRLWSGVLFIAADYFTLVARFVRGGHKIYAALTVLSFWWLLF